MPPASCNPTFTTLKSYGIDVIIRVNYGYADGSGTLPPIRKLEDFERAVVATMRSAKGVSYFQYGNEINNPAEWPTGESLTPAGYVESYNRIWWALPVDVKIGPAPLDPYYGPGSDNGAWWQEIMTTIDGADVLFLHSKTQSNDPAEIESDVKFSDHPLRWQFLHFRTFESSLMAVPDRFKDLPVYITEANPQRLGINRFGWQSDNTEWIKRCKEWIEQWNSNQIHQPISGVVFYRWNDDDWKMHDKPQLLTEVFR